MKLSRPLRFLTALIALCGLLFAQLALAAYACPIQASTTKAVHALMTDCPGMTMGIRLNADLDQPALCAAHAHSAEQSLDKPAPPLVQPFVAATLSLTLAAPATAVDPLPQAAGAPLLAHSGAPPLTVRHCSFQI
ncbi:MAG TPA: hypothetical protein DCW29_21045 [Janthinobacterium sp.]|nr:hypothetical protein [Janthinobacterium sp.]